MKFNPIALVALALFLGIGLFSCEKTEQEEMNSSEEEAMTAEDLATLEDLTADIEEEVDKAEENNAEPCVIITVSPDDRSFPRTITIDYGEGCTGKNGRVRSGKIIVEKSGPVRQPGSERTVSFVDFFIDGVQVTGSKKLKNVSADPGRLSSVNRVVSIELIFPDGKTAGWSLDQTYSIIEGGDTRPVADDVMQLEGSASGFNREGGSFSTSITEPLLRRRLCRWTESGVREITVNGRTATLDYGEAGDCDRLATLTNSQGESRTIRIQPWWRR